MSLCSREIDKEGDGFLRYYGTTFGDGAKAVLVVQDNVIAE